MKKILLFLTIIIIVFFAYLYVDIEDYKSLLNSNKEYFVSDVEKTDLKTLDKSEFFCKGIVTHNNRKIIYVDYKDKIIWENESKVFTDNIYISDKYIYRCFENSIDIIDEHNNIHTITGITGEIINVSRENDKICVISKQGSNMNLLYILDQKYKIVLDAKQFKYPVTSVSVSNKSEGYCVNTIRVENNTIINNLSYNLLNDLEVWNKDIEGEAIIGLKTVDSKIIAIGTQNVYLYDIDGNLMWKNSIYNKIINFVINDKTEKIHILFKKNENLELLCYNFNGKVKEIYKIPENIRDFKMYDDKVYLYNSNLIGINNNDSVNILWDNKEDQIMDFYVDDDNMYILFKNALYNGKIKTK